MGRGQIGRAFALPVQRGCCYRHYLICPAEFEGVKNLGSLEAAIMEVLWDAPGEALRVREVLQRLPAEPPRAYTTVMTVLDNLYRKGWTVRHGDGRGYRYFPAQPRAQAAAQAIREVLDSVADTEAVLLHFAQNITEEEAAALRRALRQRTRAQS
jgi:predicted transcriptional regulator